MNKDIDEILTTTALRLRARSRAALRAESLHTIQRSEGEARAAQLLEDWEARYEHI